MPATNKGKFQVKVWQVDGTKQFHTLWPVKLCPKASANLFSLMCELLQGNGIILDRWIKSPNGWVAGVDFLQDSNNERAVSATVLPKKNINDLHVELGHPSETITCITTKAFGIQVTSTFKTCEDCAMGKANQQTVSKMAVPPSQILGESLFFQISSPSTSTFGRKHH